MEKYTHLSYQERAKINMELLKGAGVRQIAYSIGRNPSTVSRELRRNGGELVYHPSAAESRAQIKKACRTGETKIGKNPVLQGYIEGKLTLHWAPQVIAARWNQEQKEMATTSPEAIYQWIYSKEQQPKELYKLLRRHKKKRGIRKSRPAQVAQVAKARIAQRPAEAEHRSEVGHCEADLVFCQGSQSMNVMTVVDRATRTVAIIKNESKGADVIEDAVKNKLPERLPFAIKSITSDNGSEFANHQKYQAPTFFCDPHSPWQKGSIEKVNEQLRAYLPFNRPLASVTQAELDQIATHLNSIPREILNFMSPLELVNQLLYQKYHRVALQP